MTLKIAIRDLCKNFGTKEVLRGINLDVHTGESLVIIGASGTGKSVLLKCLLNLLPADSGSILYDGVEVMGESPRAQEERLNHMGMVFQGSALFDSLSVWENVAFGLMNALKMNRDDAKALALEALASVGLDETVAHLSPAEISGGMQRRVALARAIVIKPDTVFFDEPTAGLDPIFSSIISQLIRKHVSQLGATAITITHDMKCARTIGDRIAMIHEGRIIWCGPAQEIDHVGDPHVQQFIHGIPDDAIAHSSSRKAA